MSLKLTIAALAAGTLITWSWAQAAPEAAEAEAPAIILEVQPPSAGGAAEAEVEQAVMTMLLMQLLMGGMQAESESAGMAPVMAPLARGQQQI